MSFNLLHSKENELIARDIPFFPHVSSETWTEWESPTIIANRSLVKFEKLALPNGEFEDDPSSYPEICGFLGGIIKGKTTDNLKKTAYGAKIFKTFSTGFESEFEMWVRHFRTLAENIKKDKLMSFSPPIIYEDGSYYLVDGHRRLILNKLIHPDNKEIMVRSINREIWTLAYDLSRDVYGGKKILYHTVPLDGLSGFRTARPAGKREELIKKNMPKKCVVMDLGSCYSYMAYDMRSFDRFFFSIESNPTSAKIGALTTSTMGRLKFHNIVSTDDIYHVYKKPMMVDVCLFLSTLHNMLPSGSKANIQKLLMTISRNCRIMFFEMGDSQLEGIDIKQNQISDWILSMTEFNYFQDLGETGEQNRRLFIFRK
jgi:hypothetical protein